MADQNSIIKTIFKRIDTSGDGKLSYAEVDILLDPRKNPKRGYADDWRSLLDLEENKKISSVISNISKKVEIKEPSKEQQQEGKITFEEFYQELRGQKNVINFFSVITGGEHIYSEVECDDNRFTRGRF